MPFPKKEYYIINTELENEEYNNLNSNFGNSINNNAAYVDYTGLFGNIHYHNYSNFNGLGLFGYNQYINDAVNNDGTGLFAYNNNAGTSLFGYNGNKTGISLFGNKTTNLFGNFA